MDKRDKKIMVETLKRSEFENAFDIVTNNNWWAHDDITSDMERKNRLYEAFVDYYNLVTIEGVGGGDAVKSFYLISKLKGQLDYEVDKVSRGIYLSEVEKEKLKV